VFEEPAVSVVMAVYNGTEFLSEAIESVLGQTFTDFEFIIIDDGSTDGTSDIVDRYASADPRLRVYRQEHARLAAALNRGIKLARGKYIARMDADDVAYPHRFERQVQFFDKRQDLAVLGGAFELVGSHGQRGVIVRLPEDDAAIKSKLSSANCLAHPTVMVRKDILTEMGGYRGQFVHAEDYDLWLRIAERHVLANLAEPILRYRFHRNQVSFQDARQQAFSALGARFAAEQRRQRGIDPFEHTGCITENVLIRSGLGEEEIERAVWCGFVQRIETAARIGERAIHRYLPCDPETKPSQRPADRETSRVPKVSIIVPCYNQARFLADALDSVLAQTEQDWECIVVNDGSTDGSRELAARYAELDGRFRYIEQNNQGVGAARNAGLRASHGRYIQFLDADDALFPRKISSQLAVLKGETAPALVYCDYYRAEGARLGGIAAHHLSGPRLVMSNPLLDMAARWETELSIPIHCMLFDARFFKELAIHFDEHLPTHEDWDCWMQILRLNPVVKHVAKKMAVYRIHKESMCKDAVKMRSGFDEAIEKQLGLFRRDPDLRRVLQRKRREMQRHYLRRTSKIAHLTVCKWAQRAVRQYVPWPMQKMIGRIVALD
jgi:glycosyltransferase involved in cell wall biosynthesis